ncbi:hypothetical protein [Desulfovibrio cuneatus]|uniref:hypothetical protein n=1 Tax=Desulfovibrio cuneatus TaxID=159728 RepID=UPI0003FEDDEB|nr:hypothetical protein [Desulfovibrio cuneatus]
MAFDYKGYDEETLLALCAPSGTDLGLARWVYWTAEVYSFGVHMRDFAFYPSFLPLYCYTDHGAGALQYDTILPHELTHDAPVQFYHSPDAVDLFKTVSDKPCHCMYSPFVWYRRKNNITQSPVAKGTLVFPPHSTTDVLLQDGYIERYIEHLKGFPEHLQPVCVCLHMHDINNGQYKLFLQNNIPVYTAGNGTDIRFAERWYDIVRHFAYTSSSGVGSSTYYSIEMGIPFFISGEPVTLVNTGNVNLPLGELKDSQILQETHIFFTRNGHEITPEKKHYVEKHLGLYNSISRVHMAKILYAAYCKHGKFLKDLFHAFKNASRPLRKKLGLVRKNTQ